MVQRRAALLQSELQRGVLQQRDAVARLRLAVLRRVVLLQRAVHLRQAARRP